MEDGRNYRSPAEAIRGRGALAAARLAGVVVVIALASPLDTASHAATTVGTAPASSDAADALAGTGPRLGSVAPSLPAAAKDMLELDHFERFGDAVAFNADTALVGAPWDDTRAGCNAGSVYVFVRSGSRWSRQARLMASDAAAFDEFGHSVALRGNHALVGAPHADTDVGRNVGSVYVFVRSGATWTERAKLNAPKGVAADGAMAREQSEATVNGSRR